MEENSSFYLNEIVKESIHKDEQSLNRTRDLSIGPEQKRLDIDRMQWPFLKIDNVYTSITFIFIGAMFDRSSLLNPSVE